MTTRAARKERQIARRKGALARLPRGPNSKKLGALGGEKSDAGRAYVERRTASLVHERSVLEQRIARG